MCELSPASWEVATLTGGNLRTMLHTKLVEDLVKQEGYLAAAVQHSLDMLDAWLLQHPAVTTQVTNRLPCLMLDVLATNRDDCSCFADPPGHEPPGEHDGQGCEGGA